MITQLPEKEANHLLIKETIGLVDMKTTQTLLKKQEQFVEIVLLEALQVYHLKFSQIR